MQKQGAKTMSSNKEIKTGRPVALKTVSDVEKATAIEAALMELTRSAFVVYIESIDYLGRFGRRGPFRNFTEIRFALFSGNNDGAQETLVAAIRQVDDQSLADAIATQIGKRAGEQYEGFIAVKRVSSRRKTGYSIADLHIQLSCPLDE